VAEKAMKQVLCDALLQGAKGDRDIVVLCSDSRGSGSMAPFAQAYPEQFVEVGIAEQNLVSIAAGLARCGKRSFAVSPACFLSTRSLEQVKVDVAYSETNVVLIGISGGVSYGSLGMTHHSLADIAAIASIPGMRVYLPSDNRLAALLMEQLILDHKPAYLRVGRNPVPDCYQTETLPFMMDRAIVARKGGDVCLVACGEMVRVALDAADLLATQGITCRVLDMYCVKPLDTQALLDAARETRAILTVEEHGPFGGLGSMVCQTLAETACPVRCLSLPDAPCIAGTSKEVFAYYGLTADGIAENARIML
jgi:transketolase